jgi:N-acetylmuramoyl-L-alanine amidase
MMRKHILIRVLLATGWLALLCLAGTQQDNRVEIYDLRPYTHSTFTRIAVDVGALREYNSDTLFGPDRIFVDIYQAKLNPILHNKTIEVKNGYVNQIRIGQKNATTVRVVVDLDFEEIRRYNVFHLFDPFRIVIDIHPDYAVPSTPPPVTPKPAHPTEKGYSLARQLGLGINRIVIDPGHGGKDPGCIGRKGTLEKEVVLDVSLRLKKILEAKTDLEVVLTRESDIFVPVENRPVIANQKQADLFVSIHANSNPRRKYSGVATFFLNLSTDPGVMELAAQENATSTKNISDMDDILRRIVRDDKIKESSDLAQRVQSQLVKRLGAHYKGVNNLGIKGGPFWVLIGGDMPSVLVEVSHLSNSQEESRLRTGAYREHIAQGITTGILEYIDSLGKGIQP